MNTAQEIMSKQFIAAQRISQLVPDSKRVEIITDTAAEIASKISDIVMRQGKSIKKPTVDNLKNNQ